MTVFATVCILALFGGGFRNMLLNGNGLFHHTLCPAVSVISYIFWEPHFHVRYAWLIPSCATLAYGITMMVLNGARPVKGLEGEPDDFVVIKKRFSGFFRTNLKDYLDENNINTVLIAGTQTPNCGSGEK